jgi:pyruvate,water dikinase
MSTSTSGKLPRSDLLTRLLGTPHPYMRLGTGSVARAGAGPKAHLLDRAARAGMSVPPGIVLLDEAWHLAQHQGLLQMEGCRIVAAEPERLLHALGLWPAHHSPVAAHEAVAVRSAFSHEDGKQRSLAGRFQSRLRIDPRDAEALAGALCEVWASALEQPADCRRDLLIMKMVPAKHAGVAFSERAYEDDLLNLVEGTAEDMLDGTVAGERLILAKLQPYERMPQPLVFTNRDARLQEMLRVVRLVFAPGNWDIEWADDGRRCWLLQVRPITRSPGRDELFTLANHREILPDLPSTYMSSLIAGQAGALFEYYRRFDRELPANRPFIEIFAGRPLINLSLLLEMMRAWGLPSRLVTANIGAVTPRDYPANPARMIRKLPVLLRQGLAQLRAPGAARRDIRRMHQLAEQPIENFAAANETLGQIYSLLVRRMFGLTAAMSLPLALLRRSGTLQAHSLRQQSIATALYSDRAELQAIALRRNLIAALQRGELPADAEFQAAWQAYLAKHGHRGVYESDIARPRLREDPREVLKALARMPQARAPLPPRGLRGWLFQPVWRQAARAINAREQLRYEAMRDFERLRSRLLELAEAAVARGALPQREDIWLLSIEEAARLDEGWIAEAEFVAQRAAEREHLAAYQLPETLRRSDDLEQFRHGQADKDKAAQSCLRGLSLGRGEVSGRAWLPAEPAGELPPGYEAAQTILVVRAVDAGWISSFGLVAGVVVETGGDLSHGSIILREIGLPAVTAVSGATSRIRSGDRLRMRADSGIVEVMRDQDAADR